MNMIVKNLKSKRKKMANVFIRPGVFLTESNSDVWTRSDFVFKRKYYRKLKIKKIFNL